MKVTQKKVLFSRGFSNKNIWSKTSLVNLKYILQKPSSKK